MTSQIIDIHARSYPAMSHIDGGTLILLTVLVKRIEGTVKAYAAIVPDNSRQDPQYKESRGFVMIHGQPLRFREAQTIWPSLKSEGYAA